MNKQEFLDLCPAYALGALDGEDLARFRALLADPVALDDEMRAALAEATHMAAQLSLAAPEATPSAAVKERLMQRVGQSARQAAQQSSQQGARQGASAASPRQIPSFEPKRSWFEAILGTWFAPRPAFAVAFGLLVVAVGLFTYTKTLNRSLNERDSALVAARTHILELRDSLSRKDALLEVIRARGLQVVAMAGTKDSPAGYGKILWDPDRKSAVLQVALPPQPRNKDYQLWVIREGKPVDAGVFQVSDGDADAGMYRIEHLVETDKAVINAFAVTVEPKGGVPQPTGAMVLLGAVQI